jgi:hypothetical protein
VTREERVFVGVEDLLEIELSCSNERCKIRVSCPLSKGFNVPNVCPSCNEVWFLMGNDERKTAMYNFFDSLKALREMKSVPFGLRFRVHTESVSGN